MISGCWVIFRISRMVETCMRPMRLASGSLLTAGHLGADRGQVLRRQELDADGEKVLFFLLQVGDKNVHQILKPRHPFRVDAGFSEADGQALEREHDRRM